jgi:YHS domain-containing protein
VKDSSAAAGPKLLDPVCDMIVAVGDARENGLTLEMDDREYAFCSAGCLKTFAKSPTRFRAKVDAWLAANPQH